MHIWGPWRRQQVALAAAAALLAGVAGGLAGAAAVGTVAPSPTEAVYQTYFVNAQLETLEPQVVLGVDGIRGAFQALCQGVPTEMARLGITSAVPAGCRVTAVGRAGAQGERLVVEADRRFFAVAPERAPIWRDQVEMTAVQVTGIREVAFQLAGQPLPAELQRRLGIPGVLPVDGRPGRLRSAPQG